jgi:hypothetical protein
MLLDTDRVLCSGASMRMVQFISAVPNPQSHERETFTVYELMHALHNWRRQLAFHRAFYDWDQEHGMAPQRARARGSCEGVPEGGDASLSNSDWGQKLILQEERWRDAVRTAKGREGLLTQLGGRGVTHMATAILTAVEALCELGIVEKCNEDALGAGRSKGKRAFDFRKRPWHTIQASEQARAHVARLRVSADVFSD